MLFTLINPLKMSGIQRKIKINRYIHVLIHAKLAKIDYNICNKY